ncbi:envelope stress response membrane protein PspB [Parasphingorhabdus sp.]|uniref:envelope stress response membrane protein PspB n=1 Tax=Parasphingorhabdus sp. TaxID=2709688 RepID=UPI003265EDC6
MNSSDFIPFFAIIALFIAFPWIIFHYVTKWKTAASITNEDEQLLDDLHSMARRLDERMETIERIMAADNPDWKQSAALPKPPSVGSPTLENIDKILKERR